MIVDWINIRIARKLHVYVRNLSLILLLAFLPSTANASATLFTGKINQYLVVNAGNLAFRVFINQNTTATCLGGGFFYIESTDPNYQVYVSGLISAALAAKTVSISVIPDQNGFCKIDYYQVNM